MPYTKEALQNIYELSPEEINTVLQTSELAIERDEYSDEEIASVSFQQAVETVKQQRLNSVNIESIENTESHTSSSEGKKKKKQKQDNPMDITELLSKARNKGIKLALMEAMQILQACGLSEKEEYSPDECNRFLEAGDLFKKQNKSLQEIAQHFGIIDDESTLPISDNLLQELGDVTALLGEEEIQVIREIVQEKAKGDVAQLPKLYLQTLLNEMRSPNFQKEAQQLRTALQNAITGKKYNSQNLPSPPNFLSLPPTSENGSISE